MEMICKKCGKQAIDPWDGKPMDCCYECEKENKESSALNATSSKTTTKVNWYILAAGIFLLFIIVAAVEDSNKKPRVFSDAQVCKAAIAVTMGRPVSIVKYHRTDSDNVHTLSYNYDGSNWTYRCKIEGNRVIWASPSGRWRTHQYDGVIRFHENENMLTVIETYNDDSSRKKIFSINEL